LSPAEQEHTLWPRRWGCGPDVAPAVFSHTLAVKTPLHVVINGRGIVKVVVDDLKGPCRAI
jgi:hypothetical protein